MFNKLFWIVIAIGVYAFVIGSNKEELVYQKSKDLCVKSYKYVKSLNLEVKVNKFTTAKKIKKRSF